MSDLVVTNWFGDITSHPQVVVEANSVDDIVAVMQDSARYPSPVRAIGSNHSTTPCGVADGGTVIHMKMNQVLSFGADTVTVEAGALYIDIAQELEDHGLQFYVNTEIGSLSAGSAACAGTKDASMPGEYGQVGSYVVGVKMVLPSGELLEVTEDQPELLQKVRSSYGTFGIVYEVTFRVRPLLPMAVYHETFALRDFTSKLAELKARNESMMFYFFPFEDLVTVEFRRYNPGAKGEPNRHAWQLRNYLWGRVGPRLVHDAEQTVAIAAVRYGLIDGYAAIWRFNLEHIVRDDNTIPADQIIRYPTVSDESRYTFSLFAFPEDDYAEVLDQFFDFCRRHHEQSGYRPNLPAVGYRVAQDQQSLLSYSYDGTVMTIDPVSTGNPGWTTFLDAYNQFCSERGGIPLLNQTDRVTPAQVKKGLGDRLRVFEEARQEFDPRDRLLNDYFRGLLSKPSTTESSPSGRRGS
ncbi:MAG: FAD-binding oxidoreductase [Mycobacterium leprae]